MNPPLRRSWAKRIWYAVLHVVCRLAAVVVFRVRVEGRRHVPREGAALVLSNHQSHLDPVLAGLACDRRLNYLARSTLFRFTPFRWLIQSLDAIAIDREGLALAGLKETLRRLKAGEMVLIFPEGTRTPDGNLGPIKSGFCAVARRANVPLVPMAIDGTFDAWPRDRLLPGVATLRVRIGPPILPDQVARFDDEQLVAEVRRRIADCLAAARASRQPSGKRRSSHHPPDSAKASGQSRAQR